MERFALAAFRSRQSVVRFDDALQNAGLRTQIVSTPPAVSMGCGLSVRLDSDQLPLAMEIYRKHPESNLIGFYIAELSGGKIRVLPVRV